MTSPAQKEQNFYNIPYQKAIGSLLFLVQGTRSVIAFAVNFVSKFNNNFNNSYWTVVKRIFRYLSIKGAINVALKLKTQTYLDFVMRICVYAAGYN